MTLTARPHFPLLYEPSVALGVVSGKGVAAPTLAVAGALLVARGADQLIVPAPTEEDREWIEEGLIGIPRSRLNLVKVVDRHGDTLQQVRAYLGPLERQATKWPEDAFVSLSERFLYQLALATRYRAGIADDSVADIRGLVPMIDPGVFSGEARYRLSELFALLCSYEPAAPELLGWSSEVARVGASPDVWRILDLAEFRSVVAASGRIGLLLRPKVALRRMRRLLGDLVSHPRAKSLLRLGSTAVDVAGAPRAAEALGKFLEKATDAASPTEEYWPPFLPLDTQGKLGLYRATLRAADSRAKPVPGTIFVFRDRIGHSWLNTEDGHKLEDKAKERLSNRIKEVREARRAQRNGFASRSAPGPCSNPIGKS